MCNFGDLKDSMVRDQLVYGTKDKKLRSCLLREIDLSLSKAIDWGVVSDCRDATSDVRHAARTRERLRLSTDIREKCDGEEFRMQ